MEVTDWSFSITLNRTTCLPVRIILTLPAVSGTIDAGATLSDRVVSELAAVIESQQSPTGDKLEAIFACRDVRSHVLTNALQRALNASDKVLRLSAAAALLERDDLSAMGTAEDALMNPEHTSPTYLLQNLSSAISKGVRNEHAIPFLRHLLAKAPDPDARRAAASALRDIGTLSSATPLAGGLDDTDFEVRYMAVIGLAEITGQNDWRPLMEDFRAHEQQYLDYWMDWARSHLATSPTELRQHP